MKSFVLKNHALLIQHFLIYGLLGLVIEVIYTGLASLLAGDYSMHGFTFLIMLPIYGSAVFLEPFVFFFNPLPWWIRGLFYLVLFWITEYISGTILILLLGYCPWNYNDPLNINGIITLRMAPEWFFAGLGFEKIFRFLLHNKI
jgi:uncharacterized membrane protein